MISSSTEGLIEGFVIGILLPGPSTDQVKSTKTSEHCILRSSPHGQYDFRVEYIVLVAGIAFSPASYSCLAKITSSVLTISLREWS